MKKRFFAAALCLILALALLPIRVAEATVTQIFIAGQSVLAGYWKNNDTKTGVVAGTSTDWNAYYDNGTLYLRGLDVTSNAVLTAYPGLVLEGDVSYAVHANGGDLTINLSGSNTINTNDPAVHMRATLYVTGGTLTVEGNGTLTANAQATEETWDSHGVYTRSLATEFCDLIVKGNARLIGVVTNDPNPVTAGYNGSFGVYADGPIRVLDSGSIHGTGGQALMQSGSVGVAGLDTTLRGNGSIIGIGSSVVDGTSIGLNLEGIEIYENGRLTGTGGNAGDLGSSFGVNAFGTYVTGNDTLMAISGVAGTESCGLNNYGENINPAQGFSMDGGAVTVRSPATGIGSGIYTAYDEIVINGGRFTAQGAAGALDNGVTNESTVTLGPGVAARMHTNYAGPGVTDYVSGEPILSEVQFFQTWQGDAPIGGGGTAATDVPKTGDDASIALLGGLILLSGAGLAVSEAGKRRAAKQR